MALVSRDFVKRNWNILFAIGYILFIFVIVFFACLALDVFTIPYLTPLAHFFKIIISPFIPFFAPLLLGIFIKSARRPTWPGKKMWLFIIGIQVVNQASRVTRDFMRLADWEGLANEHWGGFGIMDGTKGRVCGLDICTSDWVQTLCIVGVVIAECLNFSWDAGHVDRYLDYVVEEDAKRRAAKKEEQQNNDMEKGLETAPLAPEVTDEKAAVRE